MNELVMNYSRRRLLLRLALGMALVGSWRSGSVLAGDSPPVTADDPMAKALKYTTDASKAADAKPGSKCANCALYQGAAGSLQGGCTIFPAKSVNAGGWCASWTAKKA